MTGDPSRRSRTQRTSLRRSAGRSTISRAAATTRSPISRRRRRPSPTRSRISMRRRLPSGDRSHQRKLRLGALTTAVRRMRKRSQTRWSWRPGEQPSAPSGAVKVGVERMPKRGERSDAFRDGCEFLEPVGETRFCAVVLLRVCLRAAHLTPPRCEQVFDYCGRPGCMAARSPPSCARPGRGNGPGGVRQSTRGHDKEGARGER